MMEAVRTPETSVYSKESTWRYISEDFQIQSSCPADRPRSEPLAYIPNMCLQQFRYSNLQVTEFGNHKFATNVSSKMLFHNVNVIKTRYEVLTVVGTVVLFLGFGAVSTGRSAYLHFEEIHCLHL
jgi:uncharacterized membrane protein